RRQSMRPILDPCETRVSCEIRLGAGGSDGRVRRGLAASNRLIRDATAARSLASAFRNSPPACRLRLPGEREFASTEPTCSPPCLLMPVCCSLGVSDMRGASPKTLQKPLPWKHVIARCCSAPAEGSFVTQTETRPTYRPAHF